MKRDGIRWAICLGVLMSAGWIRAENKDQENREPERNRPEREYQKIRREVPPNQRETPNLEKSHREDGQPGRPGREFQTPEGMDPGGAGALDQWLAKMKKRNPDEFARLMRLREENPEAFRAKIRERLQKAREENRQRSESKFSRPAGEPIPVRGPDETSERSDQNLREISDSWRAASTGEERSRIEGRLRSQFMTEFQQRMRMQEERLVNLERQIEDLRRDIIRQREFAERVVDRKVRQTLERREPKPKGD